MTIKNSILVGFSLSAALCLAQTGARSGAQRSTCPGGKASAELEPLALPASLDDLVRSAELIVDGTVSTVLPAVNRNSSLQDAIETDSVVSFGSVLYGALPSTVNSIVIAQEGGKTADCEKVIVADPLLIQGDRYVFFLDTDERQQPPNTTGFPRYIVVGIWSGKAKVQGGAIQFNAAAAPGLQGLDGVDVNTFLSKLKDRIAVLKLLQHP